MRQIYKKYGFVFLMVFLIPALMVPTQSPGDSWVLVNGVTILDLSYRGQNSNDLMNGYILIKNGLIEKIGDIRSVPDCSDKVRTINARGKFLLPGLIDGFAAINNQAYANAYLYMGVTTIIAV